MTTVRDPVQARAIRTKKKIIESGADLFSERGYEAVGVAELCEASLITKPTLYHYFGSKRGLLSAIVAERGAPLSALVSEASVYTRDVVLGMKKIADAFVRSAREDPDFARLRLALAFAPPSSEGYRAGAARHDAVFSRIESFFKAAASDHGNMKGRSRAYAASFIGTLDTYVGLYLAGHISLSERVVSEALRQFMYGIFS